MPSLSDLSSKKFDLLIVGGGINGAGTAREAVLRGLSVCLIEKNDWAYGTSSRSTKLVHGGVRYLENYQFGLVMEASRERRLLQQSLAPHLVHPLSFLIPIYKGDQRGTALLRAGLWLYDLMALFRNVHNHRMLSSRQALELVPSLDAQNLLGAAQLWDCSMNDARLVLENVLDAAEHGAVCRNYTRLVSVDSLQPGQVRAQVRDEESGQSVELQAKLLINAAGPWVDEVAGLAGQKDSKKIRPSKGIHLITRPLSAQALLAPIPDGRVFFIIPRWFEGRQASLIGTTDKPFNGSLDALRAEEDEISYLIRETKRVLPQANLRREEIWSTYAGVRPMANRLSSGESLQAVPREAVLHLEEGMLSITGGKYTTYRSLCQQVVEKAAKAWPTFKLGPSLSARQALPGAPPNGQPWESYFTVERERLSAAYGLGSEQVAWLLQTYGSRTGRVLDLLAADPSLRQPLLPGLPPMRVQAAWAALHENALHLADFYLRRTFLGLLPSQPAALQAAASAMGHSLGWDPARQAQEVESTLQILKEQHTNIGETEYRRQETK